MDVTRPAPAAARALAILDFLAAHPTEAFTLSELARELDMNLASAHAVLAAMTEAGYLVRHPSHKTYRLGPSTMAVGHAALESHPIIGVARPEMERIATATDLECLASAPLGSELVVVARVGRPPPERPLALVGQRMPLIPPLGTMFVAWSSPEEIEAWLGRADPGEPPEAQQRYRRVLESARVLGYSVGVAEEGRMVAVAPVEGDPATLDLRADARYAVGYLAASAFDERGRVALVINLDGFGDPLSPAEIEDYGRRLRQSALVITRAVHGRPGSPATATG